MYGKTLDEVLVKATYDFEMYNSFALRIVWNTDKTRISLIDYMDISKLRYTTEGLNGTIYTDNSHQGIILSNTFDSGSGTGQLVLYALSGTSEQWGNVGNFYNQAETIDANFQGRSSKAIDIGNIVIYNNLHYILGDQSNGSSPDSDSAYILLDKSLSNGYVLTNDIVEFAEVGDYEAQNLNLK